MNKTTENQAAPEGAKILYGIRELTEKLSISRSKLYNLFRSGELAFIKIGERRLVEASAITDFIQRMKQSTATV